MSTTIDHLFAVEEASSLIDQQQKVSDNHLSCKDKAVPRSSWGQKIFGAFFFFALGALTNYLIMPQKQQEKFREILDRLRLWEEFPKEQRLTFRNFKALGNMSRQELEKCFDVVQDNILLVDFSVCDFSKMKENQIEVLFQKIETLTHLQAIDLLYTKLERLTKNQLETLFTGLQNQPNLQVLILSGVKLNEMKKEQLTVFFDGIQKLTHLKKLYLSWCGLNELEKDQLESLFDVIKKLDNLQVLNLSYNDLSKKMVLLHLSKDELEITVE